MKWASGTGRNRAIDRALQQIASETDVRAACCVSCREYT